MKVEIFKEYLEYLNSMFVEKRMHAAIIVDGPQVHRNGVRCNVTKQLIVQPYSNLKLFFFDPNITALVQPMDQGVILSFKCSYRRILSQNLIEKTRNIIKKDEKIFEETGIQIKPNLAGFIYFADAIEFAIQAWNLVSVSTIQNAWIKSSIPSFLSIQNWMNDSDLHST